MMGGESNLRGTNYESYLVVEALFRLLLGEVTQVTWQDLKAGDGVDLRVDEDGMAWGIQAKSGTTRSWTLAALTDEKVPAYAHEWLSRASRNRFRLHAVKSADDLQRLSDQARIVDAETWRAGWKPRDSAMIMAFAGPSEPMIVHALFQRIEVHIQNYENLRIVVHRAASRFPESGKLIGVLTRLTLDQPTKPWDSPSLRAALHGYGIDAPLAIWDDGWHDRLRQARERFRRAIERQRGMSVIARDDVVTEVLTAIAGLKATGGVVAVHGPGGAGKSEVLAAVLLKIPDDTIVLPVSVVGLDPSQPWSDLGLGDQPLRTLMRASRGRSMILIIDQLDQAVWAAPRLLRSIQDLLIQAAELGVVTVVGCRSVDLDDPRLAGWLRPQTGNTRRSNGPDKRVPIGVLSIVQVESALIAQGVAPGDLDNATLALIRRPIGLRLALDLARKGQSRRLLGVRKLVDLLIAWREWIDSELERMGIAELAQGALARFAQHCSREGVVVAPADAERQEIVQALVDLGVLVWQDADAKRIGWSHQHLLDHHLAREWLRRADAGESLSVLIGAREHQDQRTGNRMRLLMPGLIDRHQLRDQLQALLLGDGLRAMVRLGCYRGLAELDAESLKRFLPMVQAMLAHPTHWRMTLIHLVSNQPAWIKLLESWFTAVWVDQTRRALAVHALSSVEESWGDGVARILTAWRESDPQAIVEAQSLFHRAHTRESEAGFRHWLYALSYDSVRHRTVIEWGEFFDKHPRRAAQALAVLMPEIDWSGRTKEEGVVTDLPGSAPSFAALGKDALDVLWEGWFAANCGDRPRRVYGPHDQPPWSRLIDLLAKALASAWSRGELAWSEVLAKLPDPLRWCDQVLLLRAIANTAWPEQLQVDHALRWFAATPTAWRLSAWDLPPWQESRPALTALSSTASPEVLALIQERLCTTSEPLDYESERQEGASAWHLLGVIPEERLIPQARQRLNELKPRFKDLDQEWFQAIRHGAVRSIGSDLPRNEIDGYSDAQWRQLFRKAADHPGRVGEGGPDTIGERSVDRYATDLRQCAQRHPRRFLSLIRQRLDDDLSDMTSAALSGLLSPPDGTPQERQLTDDDRLALVADEGLLVMADCQCDLAQMIRNHAELTWPDRIVDVLCQWSRQPLPSVSGNSSDRDGLHPVSRWSQCPLVAIAALGRLACCHPQRQGQVWGAVQELPVTGREDLAAAGVMAAIVCRSIDQEAIDQTVLRWTIDPLVAAQDDVSEMLRWLAQYQAAAADRLLALAERDEDWIQRQAGRYRVLLAMDARVPSSACDADKFPRHVGLRCAMAEVVGKIFEGDPLDRKIYDDVWPQWLLDLALSLADDADKGVKRSIAGIWHVSDQSVWDSRRSVARLMRNRDFVQRFSRTQAVVVNPDPIISACLANADLISWATVIGDIVTQALAADRWFRGQELVDIVGRLTEEAEQVGDPAARRIGLDAWDRLIEAGWREAAERTTA